jgi:hypothetical protein
MCFISVYPTFRTDSLVLRLLRVLLCPLKLAGLRGRTALRGSITRHDPDRIKCKWYLQFDSGTAAAYGAAGEWGLLEEGSTMWVTYRYTRRVLSLSLSPAPGAGPDGNRAGGVADEVRAGGSGQGGDGRVAAKEPTDGISGLQRQPTAAAERPSAPVPAAAEAAAVPSRLGLAAAAAAAAEGAVTMPSVAAAAAAAAAILAGAADADAPPDLQMNADAAMETAPPPPPPDGQPAGAKSAAPPADGGAGSAAQLEGGPLVGTVLQVR